MCQVLLFKSRRHLCKGSIYITECELMSAAGTLRVNLVPRSLLGEDERCAMSSRHPLYLSRKIEGQRCIK